MKVLRIECDIENFYLKYLVLVNPMLHLGDTQIKIFAYLLYLNDKYNDIEESEREFLLFNTETKKALENKLNISRASLENHFSKLRKKGFVIGRKIAPQYHIRYETHRDLLFSFRVKEDEG